MKNSFSYSGAFLWTSLPVELRQANSLVEGTAGTGDREKRGRETGGLNLPVPSYSLGPLGLAASNSSEDLSTRHLCKAGS